jgi:hypothetical protein
MNYCWLVQYDATERHFLPEKWLLCTLPVRSGTAQNYGTYINIPNNELKSCSEQ